MSWGNGRIWGYRTAALACLALGLFAEPAAAYITTYTDADGHTITFSAGGTVPNTARDQLFVDVLGSLVHGDEMNLLTVDLTATDAGHNDECGGVPACYSYGVSPGRIHIRGFDTGADPRDEADNVPLTAETMSRGLIAHEYGHHVANHRRNDGALPGGASANGTKRWASYMRICPRVRSGRLGEDRWATMPSEGWAESYRMAHIRAVPGLWLIGRRKPDDWFLDASLRPDSKALGLVREDVLDPYAGPRTSRLHGRLRANGRERRVKGVRTPLDGRLTATLQTSGSLKAKLSLNRGRDRVARGRGSNQRLGYEVCGARTLKFEVRRVSGVGGYTVRVTKP